MFPNMLIPFGDIAAVAGSVVVWWASRQEVPYTHRMHAILIPARIEIAAGIRAFQEVPRKSPPPPPSR